LSVRIVTFNVNGIRAAQRRGFEAWLAGVGADVVALQEVRCRPGDLPAGVFGDYEVAYDAGQLPGRNGVALLTRLPPARVFGWSSQAVNPFLDEGRFIGVELADVPLTVISVYVPKGGVPRALAPHRYSRGGYTPDQEEARYKRKVSFLRRFADELGVLRRTTEAVGRGLLVLGDYNIAHGPADLRNWRTNLASEGFLPAERAWLDAAVGPTPSTIQLEGKKILAPLLAWPPFIRPFVDVVRALHPDEDGPYSWWSWRGQAFANDVGWRIDYHLASPGLAAKATAAWVDRAASYETRSSDHAPVIVDYAL
jgi:exodeoxyribonuclease-3